MKLNKGRVAFFLALYCLAMSFCCLEYAVAADKKIVTVIVGTANLRDEPSLDSKSVNFVSKGAVLEVTDEFTEPTGKKWYKVKTSGRQLWLADKVVDMSVFRSPDPPDPKDKINKPEAVVIGNAEGPGDKTEKAKEAPVGEGLKASKEDIPAAAPQKAVKPLESRQAEPQPAKGKVLTVTVSSATLRAKPSADSDAAEWVAKGTVLTAIDEFTGPEGRKWYKIRTSRGKKLWIIDKAVRVSDAKPPETQEGRKKRGPVDAVKQGAAPPAAPNRAAVGAPEKDVRKPAAVGSDEGAYQELLDAGNAFFREGKCEEFIAVYQKAIGIVEKQKDLAAEGKLHYNISECYTRLKRYKDSVRHLDDAITLAVKTDNPELEILALIDKSRVYAIMGEKNAAFELLKSASDKANREMFLRVSPGENLNALISFQMAAVLFDIGEKEKAKGKLDYALTVNSDFKLEEDITALLKSVDAAMHGQVISVSKMLDDAWALYEKGDYKGMEKVSMEALDIAKRLGYKKGMFGGYYYLAMSAISLEKYDSSIDYALHAQELAEKGPDYNRLGMVYNLTGNIFKQKKAYDKALHYYNKNLDIVRRAGNREGESIVFNNIGNALMDKGEYRDALKYYEDSVSIGIGISASRHFIAQGFLSIGRAKNKTGDYAGAEKSMLKAMHMFRDLGNAAGELVCLWETAANYASQGEYKTAVKVLEDNLNSAGKQGMRQGFIDDIISYSEKAKDYLKAEKYRKK